MGRGHRVALLFLNSPTKIKLCIKHFYELTADDQLPDVSPFAHHQANIFPLSMSRESLPSATSDEATPDTLNAPESPLQRPLSADRDPVEVVLSSAKLFACMDLEESRSVFDQCELVVLQPKQKLFEIGDSSESGIFIVFQGELGVFPSKQRESTMFGKLHCGESVGDMDVLDGAPRTVSCAALDEECTLVQVPRSLFMTIVINDPQVLNTYLHRVSECEETCEENKLKSSLYVKTELIITVLNPSQIKMQCRLSLDCGVLLISPSPTSFSFRQMRCRKLMMLKMKWKPLNLPEAGIKSIL